MLDVPELPNPQYPLQRYSSAVLLCWYERAIFVNCVARLCYRKQVDFGEPALLTYGKAREAAIFGLAIQEVLLDRDYDTAQLDRMVDEMEGDVFS